MKKDIIGLQLEVDELKHILQQIKDQIKFLIDKLQDMTERQKNIKAIKTVVSKKSLLGIVLEYNKIKLKNSGSIVKSAVIRLKLKRV